MCVSTATMPRKALAPLLAGRLEPLQRPEDGRFRRNYKLSFLFVEGFRIKTS